MFRLLSGLHFRFVTLTTLKTDVIAKINHVIGLGKKNIVDDTNSLPV